MWNSVALSEVASFVRGLTYSKKDEVDIGGLAVLRATNISLEQRKIVYDEIRHIRSPEKINENKLAKVGDLLMCTASGSKSHLGKVALVTEDLGMAFGGFMAALRCNASCSPKYLFYVLTSNSFMKKLSSISEGANINNLKFSQIEDFEFQLPSLAEQQRIVAKLDAAFAQIDEAILKIEAKLLNSEKIYLNGIDAHFKEMRAEMKISKLLEVTSKIGSGATPKGGKAAYKTEGISLIRSMNVHDMDFRWKDLAKIDDAQADKLSNVEICKNDVLLNITGASVARCCVVDEDALPARVNQHVAIIRPLEGTVLPNYLAYLLVSKTYKDLLLSVGEGGGATRQAITKAEIEQFKISYPSRIDEQASNVQKFDELREYAIELKTIYNEQIKNFQSLKYAILAQELRSEAA